MPRREKAVSKAAYSTSRRAFRVLLLSAVATAGVIAFFGEARDLTWWMSGQTDADEMIERWRG